MRRAKVQSRQVRRSHDSPRLTAWPHRRPATDVALPAGPVPGAFRPRTPRSASGRLPVLVGRPVTTGLLGTVRTLYTNTVVLSIPPPEVGDGMQPPVAPRSGRGRWHRTCFPRKQPGELHARDRGHDWDLWSRRGFAIAHRPCYRRLGVAALPYPSLYAGRCAAPRGGRPSRRGRYCAGGCGPPPQDRPRPKWRRRETGTRCRASCS
jgi:hypothetical protein